MRLRCRSTSQCGGRRSLVFRQCRFSLQIRPDVPECGWVRWVATELDRRREGLARALVIGVLAMAE